MNDEQRNRHAAAMLIHQVGSGIQALESLSTEYALDNLPTLHEDFLRFGRLLVRLQEIEVAKNRFYQTHQ